MAELRGLGAVHEALQAKGGAVFGISVDSPELSSQVVKDHDLNFSILCDTERSVIQSYGLVHEGGVGGGDIAIPANILIDREGNIVLKHIAEKVNDRLSAQELLDFIQTLS